MGASFVKLRLGLALTGFAWLSSAAPVTQAQTSEADRVAWIVFVDDLHIDFPNTGYLKKLVETILRDVVQEGDLAAIHTTGPGAVLADFTSRSELMPFLKKVTGGGMKPTEVLNVDGEADASYELRFRTRISLSSATVAAALLGRAEARHRGLIYVSNGHPFDLASLIEARGLATAAALSGTKVFTIDARSLSRTALPPAVAGPDWDAHVLATRDSLRVLAEQSDGFAILDGSDMPAGFQRIVSAVRSARPAK